MQQPETPKFYTRMKIHKTGIRGRPVVSSINFHSNLISNNVEFHLQQIGKNVPSYVRDTTDFLQKLDKIKNTPNNTLLVTFDVKSLYTNIPNAEGIKAGKEASNNQEIIDSNTSRSYQTQQLNTKFHKLNYKNKFIIYLMECALCKV